MEKEAALKLIEKLGGDEHNWVDFKVDYEIGGIAMHKAEFIKDVSSLANTITEQDFHYIIIGVNDNGNLVGIDPDRVDYRGAGPRHIFSFDESDIQQKIDSNLEPVPEISWYTFEEGSDKFGILKISPLESPPCVPAHNIDEDDTRHLHKGVVYLRKGSSKKVAGREEFENMIEYRIQKQREQILDGVNKAIQIGPEWIERIGDALPTDTGVPMTTIDDPDQADIEVTERLTREPASSLDNQLNEDISQWKNRGDDFIEQLPLWQYYCSPGALTLDKTALLFLTQSALKHKSFGSFWLMQTDSESRNDILLSTPHNFHRIKNAASLFLMLDNEEEFDKLIQESRTSAKYGHLRTCKNKFGNTVHNRINYLLKDEDAQYNLNHDGWRRNLDVKELDRGDIEEIIPILAEHLEDLYQIYSEDRVYGDRLEKFTNAFFDIEVIYTACIIDDYN